MGKQRRYHLNYYHTGRYEDLSDYKRRKIDKEILMQLDSRHKNGVPIQDDVLVKNSSNLQNNFDVQISVFDETGLSSPKNSQTSHSQERIRAIEVEARQSTHGTDPKKNFTYLEETFLPKVSFC